MPNPSDSALSGAETRDFRRLAGILVPAPAADRMPGADDPAIFADIVASLGRDLDAVRQGLTTLCDLAGGAFANLDAARAEAVAMQLMGRHDAVAIALGRAVLQCYYRDDRVARALGREPRPPFPSGHELTPGDWSLLEVQKARPRMWRDLDGYGG